MNNLETYKVKDNEKSYVFYLKANFAEPCLVCGVPACGREDILWYEVEKQRIAIVFDGGLLDAALSRYFDKNVTKDNYVSIPNFVKEWNEDKGWCTNDDYQGYNLNHIDFLRTIKLVTEKDNEWLGEMKILALEAQRLGLELKITKS